MLRLKNSHPKINISGELRWNEPMAGHTTFRVGGPADLYAKPRDVADVRELLRVAAAENLPCFVLGGGANILVADTGIRGLVIDMTSINSIEAAGSPDGNTMLLVGAGLPISEASAWAADNGLAGLEFIYSMPGSVGGAVWMNARCYGYDIEGVLDHVMVLRRDGTLHRYDPNPDDFGYKRSPFQGQDSVMTSVGFRLRPGDHAQLWTVMKEHEHDRKEKGHFDAPCAGSVFKNDRAFGRPSGAILDELGMRGRAVGGARVSDLHANIIVNTGGASAQDIRTLSDQMAAEVKQRFGFELEREVLLVGDWSSPSTGEGGQA